MIDSLMNLLFRCSHRRLTRPVSPASKTGQPQGHAYVVCLECGKQFEYDVHEMRIGKVIQQSQDGGVLAPEVVAPRRNRLKYVLAAVPAALMLGAILTGKKHHKPAKPGEAKPN
jgi:DNA-directed RNA polymerase subunit RPC12/RpoP